MYGSPSAASVSVTRGRKPLSFLPGSPAPQKERWKFNVRSFCTQNKARVLILLKTLPLDLRTHPLLPVRALLSLSGKRDHCALVFRKGDAPASGNRLWRDCRALSGTALAAVSGRRGLSTAPRARGRRAARRREAGGWATRSGRSAGEPRRGKG